MMRKFISFLLCLVSSSMMAQQKVYDKLILMDGDIVEGYIKVQHPGKDLVFSVDDQERTYLLEDVLAIERVKRAADDLSGLNDIIETRDGETYKGQIFKQLVGKSVYLLDDNGVERIIKNADIACQKKEKLNQAQALVEQTPFLDVVVTPTGSYQGVIVLQDYGTDETPSFLCVEDADGQQQMVEIASITEMQRVSNDQYVLVKEFKVGAGEVFFNRNLAEAFNGASDSDAVFKVDRATLQAPVVDSPLVIEMMDTPGNQQGILIRADVQTQKKKEILSFGYKEMVLSPIRPTSTTTVKETLRMEFMVSPGFYVFFIPQSKKAYICEVR
ncbi:MAG: hypothetical protein K6G46_11920 [Prevotella sp.]|nr:hypothetical protein [Prevotella sp.]